MIVRKQLKLKNSNTFHGSVSMYTEDRTNSKKSAGLTEEEKDALLALFKERYKTNEIKETKEVR